MNILLTEEQYQMLVSENHIYDKTRPYNREKLFKALKGAPGYVWSAAKGLPRFYLYNEQGEAYMEDGKKVVFTRIPQVIFDWIHGRP